MSLLYLDKYNCQINPQIFSQHSCSLHSSPRCFEGPLTGSLTLLKYTGRAYTNSVLGLLFLSLVLGGQKQKHEGAGLQEGNPWQPDIKMVQESSRTSQVAPGQTKVRERGGKEQVILKS